MHSITLVLVLGELALPGGSIIGGEEVATCGWPSVVALDGTCSGTLIHPRVVLYAAHCGSNVHFVTPGEVESEGTPIPAQCTTNPDWDHMAGGNDFAVCVLDQAIDDVAIVPILMGCEHQLLAPSVAATSVGFGLASDGPAGIKRAVTYAIDEVAIDEGDVWAGGADGSLCDGDSGGGAFVQWIDGSWRLFGVHSAVAGEPCSDATMLLTLASGAVPWIEAETGFDVTPCHDADGSWNPGPDCGEIPIEPDVGGGEWPTCATGSIGGPSSACGPPSYGPDDLAAPSIAIAEPRPGTAIPGTSADITVAIDVADDGWGLQRTWLRIDGDDVAGSEDAFPPWEVPTITLPEGSFVLEAVARDWADNEGVSTAVTIVIGEVEGSGTTSEGSSSDDGGSESSGDATPVEPNDTSTSGDGSSTAAAPETEPARASGCGCRVEAPIGIGLPIVLLLIRRRGRARSGSPPARAR